MLKILQARIPQYMNQEIPGIQPGFRKDRGTRNQIANIHWAIEKARGFQKNIYFCLIDYAKAFDCVDHNKLWKTLKEMGISDHPTVSWETCIQDKKQQLGLDMEQRTGSKLGRNMSRLYIVTLLISLLCIVHSCKMPGWMNHRLESRNCWVKYQQPQICRWY